MRAVRSVAGGQPNRLEVRVGTPLLAGAASWPGIIELDDVRFVYSVRTLIAQLEYGPRSYLVLESKTPGVCDGLRQGPLGTGRVRQAAAGCLGIEGILKGQNGSR